MPLRGRAQCLQALIEQLRHLYQASRVATTRLNHHRLLQGVDQCGLLVTGSREQRLILCRMD